MPTYLSPGVYVEEVDSGSRPIEGVGTAVAAFIGLAEDGEFNTPTLVPNWSEYTRHFGGFVAGSYLAQSVYAYFQNGGGNCYVVRIGQDPAAGRNGATRSALTAGAQAMLGSYRVVALDAGTPDGSLAVDIQGVDGDAPDGSFKLLVRRGDQIVEEYDRLTTGRGKSNVATAVNAASSTIRIEETTTTAAAAAPTVGASVTLHTPPPPAAVPSPRLTAEDYVGDVAERTGFSGLETVDTVTMVCVPDLMSAYQQGAIDQDTVKAVQLAMIAHCELMGNRIAILDPPPGLNAQQIREWRVDRAGYDSKFAALYWPWVKAADPATGTFTHMPPSGFVAGIWGRNDDSRGVHKAPANEVVRGALSLELQITKNEHDLLNPVGINCLRSFPGRGIRIWGARTLSSDPAWRYLNVRRLFNYLEESILNGTSWVVFEPNDDALWSKIRRTISAFLVNEWRKGALFGLTPDEAFFVKCDRETNPAEGIDAGQVVCQIGVAPVKPAEFVVFQLSQFSGGTSLVAE
ncbi:phage tail sheath family protein [Nakamurella deserti]|uniref:phage tail sheath family protein n=1 Tax=Nakamurella deserti TaxID=2164074 RepID=UPI000DBE33CC|nr:phage tail sheath subtilisin-like domain-containing protein [Nakamurella deserti]